MGPLLFWLIIGALAGWLAGKIMRGGGFGVLGNIVVGIVGAMIGGTLFRMIGLPPVERARLADQRHRRRLRAALHRQPGEEGPEPGPPRLVQCASMTWRATV